MGHGSNTGPFAWALASSPKKFAVVGILTVARRVPSYFGRHVNSKENTMSKHLSIASVVAFTLIGGAAAAAQDLPTYEVMGFPISPVQVSILGCSAQVQERAPVTAFTISGMPASPHQIAVLTPRKRETDERLASAKKTELR
jgi:hypothetical protein